LLLPWSPLFIRSSLFVHELRQLEPHEDESQSFIHQVRILSWYHQGWGRVSSSSSFQVAILYSSSQNSLEYEDNRYQRDIWRDCSRNPLFIKSEFSQTLSSLCAFFRGLMVKRRRVAILYSSSQNSLKQIHALTLQLHIRVAILYSSSRNFLTSYTRAEGTTGTARSRNPLFIKSEFSRQGVQTYLHIARNGRRNPLFIKSEFSP